MNTNWLRSLRSRFGLSFASSRSRRKAAGKKSVPLKLETLEDRLNPSPAVPLVATSYFDSAVYEFNTNTGAVDSTLVAPNSQTILAGPAGVAVGPDGNLYLSSQNNDSIVEYNVTTQTLSTFIPSSVLTSIANANGDAAFAPAGLRFGADNELYVSLNGGRGATSGGAVIRFDMTSGSSGQMVYANTFATIATGLVQPTELTFGADAGDQNNLYVSDSGAGTVVKITDAVGASPSSSTFITAGSGGLNYPTSLNWGLDGNLYVTDLGATTYQGQVLVYNPDGSFDKVFTPSGSLDYQFPSDAVFLANGDLLTANLGPTYPSSYYGPGWTYFPTGPGTSGSITEFNPDGSYNQDLTASSFPADPSTGVTNISPTQLALDIAVPVSFLPSAEPADTINVPVNEAIAGVGGTGTVTLTVSGVSNPIPGLNVPSSGTGTITITGTPTATGTETFMVTATDALGGTATTTYSITVNAPRVTLSTTTQIAVASSYFDSAVYELDANTGTLLQTLVAPNSQTTLENPAGMTIGPDGNLYFASQGNDSIVEYNFSTQMLSTIIPTGVLTPIATGANGAGSVFAPSGLTFGPDGDLYVTLNGGHSAESGGEVIRFEMQNYGSQPVYGGTYSTIATGLIQPTELIFGTSSGDTNNLYVSDSGADSVVEIANAVGASPSSSTFIAAGSGGLNYPSALTWGPGGNLYVTDLGATTYQGQVLAYNADGSFNDVFTQPAGSLQYQFPSDALFLPNGDLLTANLGATYPTSYSGPGTSGSITEFNADGSYNQDLTGTSFAADPSTGVTNFSPTQLVLNTTPPDFSTVALAQDTVSVAYSQTITAGGGSGAITLVVSNIQNAIPGLTIPGGGTGSMAITGTPTATGTESFTVTATDTAGDTTTITYTITVVAAPAPTVTVLSQASGLVGGGTTVVITGTGFTGATAVKFGSTAVTSFTVNSATQITAVDAAGSGAVDVTVATANGTSAASSADQFTYAAVTGIKVNGDVSPIVDISSNGAGTVTATTDGTNGFAAGDTVVISGYTAAGTTGYNGTFTIGTASGNTFTIANATAGLSTLTSNNLGLAVSQNAASSLLGNQRSMVDSVAYTFSAPVAGLTTANFTLSAAASAIGLATSGSATAATSVPGMTLNSLDGGSIWVVTWSNLSASVGHSIADGVYELTLANSGRATDTFYRLFGNVVGYQSSSARINSTDSLDFSHSYLLGTGAANYLADCDYNADGLINSTDSLQLSHRYLSVWSGFAPTI